MIRTFVVDYSRPINLDILTAQMAVKSREVATIKSIHCGEGAVARTEMAPVLMKKIW